MKDKKYLIPASITLLTFSILIWLVTVKPYLDVRNMKIGQTYKYTIEKDNPFEEKNERYYRIVEIQDGYVKYYDSTLQTTFSMRSDVFVWGAELVKE